MVSNAEMFLDGDVKPNATVNAWTEAMADAPAYGSTYHIPNANNTADMKNESVSDFDDVLLSKAEEESNEEKSEEEKTYESKKENFESELLHLAELGAKAVSDAGVEYSEVLHREESVIAGRIDENFDEVAKTRSALGRQKLEALFHYVNEMYPSTFSGKERNEKEITNAENEFRHASAEEGYDVADTVNEIAITLRKDGSMGNTAIAGKMDDICKETSEYGLNFANGIIEYVNKPNHEKHYDLDNLHNKHELAISLPLSRIAEDFDKNRAQASGINSEKAVADAKKFNITMALLGGLGNFFKRSSDTVIDYINFMAENSPYKPTEKNEQSKNAAMFIDALPDDVIS